MDFDSEIQNGFNFIRFFGEITGGYKTAKFREYIQECLKADRKTFIFNMEGVKYMNSIGLGLLISALTMVQRAGGRLLLCHTDKIDEKLATTRLKNVFEIYPTEAAAIEAFYK